MTVIRDKDYVQKCSTELVPGDVIILPKHCKPFPMECDCVLLTGSCLVDESMLTGESVPVPKVPLVDNSNAVYSSTSHKSNTLFSGTCVLNVQSTSDVKAIVVRTGFSTAKGELARSILFPEETDNHLNKQMLKLSGIFFCIGVPCMAYAIYALSRFKVNSKNGMRLNISLFCTLTVSHLSHCRRCPGCGHFSHPSSVASHLDQFECSRAEEVTEEGYLLFESAEHKLLW